MATTVQDSPAGYEEKLDAARMAELEAERAGDVDQPEAPGEGEQRPDGQLVLGGINLAALTKFSNGGKKPQYSKLTVRGVSGLELPGGKGLAKGSFVRLELVAQVDEAGDKDKVDRGQGVVVDTFRKHSAFMVDARLHGVVDGPRLEESDADADLRRSVAALREQGMSDEGIKAIAGLS